MPKKLGLSSRSSGRQVFPLIQGSAIGPVCGVTGPKSPSPSESSQLFCTDHDDFLRHNKPTDIRGRFVKVGKREGRHGVWGAAGAWAPPFNTSSFPHQGDGQGQHKSLTPCLAL